MKQLLPKFQKGTNFSTNGLCEFRIMCFLSLCEFPKSKRQNSHKRDHLALEFVQILIPFKRYFLLLQALPLSQFYFCSTSLTHATSIRVIEFFASPNKPNSAKKNKQLADGSASIGKCLEMVLPAQLASGAWKVAQEHVQTPPETGARSL